MTATNLPADLPENWQQGQIVSPNGTDVGLTKQHGYNYMAEQINDTQEAVNAHTADTTNPHGVTNEQVGALGFIAKYIANDKTLDTLIESITLVNTSDYPDLPCKTAHAIVLQFYFNAQTEQSGKIQIAFPYKASSVDSGKQACAFRLKPQNDGTFGGWQELANAANYLPLDGSKAMTGRLDVDKGYSNGYKGRLDAFEQSVELRSIVDNNKYVGLIVFNEHSQLGERVVFRSSRNGSNVDKILFGEHNTALLATTIQNLIQGGSISMIKSVQRGIITIAASATEGTATLAQAVNMSKAIVLFGGSINGSGISSSYSNYWDARLVLSANNKVKAARARSADYTAIVPYQVLEFA